MHTKSKLDIGAFGLCHGYINLIGIDAGGDTVIVAKVLAGNTSPVDAEAIANADRLVLTWNCHDDLLAALKNTAAALTTCLAHYQLSMNRVDYTAREAYIVEANEAIAKATEQPATTP